MLCTIYISRHKDPKKYDKLMFKTFSIFKNATNILLFMPPSFDIKNSNVPG